MSVVDILHSYKSVGLIRHCPGSSLVRILEYLLSCTLLDNRILQFRLSKLAHVHSDDKCQRALFRCGI